MEQQRILNEARRVLMDAQTKQAGARTDLYRAQVGQIQGKIDAALAAEKNAQQIGQLVSLADTFRAPRLDNPVATNTVLRAMESGLIPDTGMTADRGSIVAALDAMARGASTQQAMGSPSAAATMMTPRNIGGTGVNALGNIVGIEQPRWHTIPANAVGVRGDQRMLGPVRLSPNQTLAFDGETFQGLPLVGYGQDLYADSTSRQPAFSGRDRPSTSATSKLGNSLGVFLKLLDSDDPAQVALGEAGFNEFMKQAGVTNRIGGIEMPSSGVRTNTRLGPNEIKQGNAIFDAQTKKFLRYAQ